MSQVQHRFVHVGAVGFRPPRHLALHDMWHTCNYDIQDGETVLSASHGYASGNLEWMTLIVQGPLIIPEKEEVGD